MRLSDHHLDPLTRHCVGCGKAAREISVIGPKCPAFYADIEGALVIITTKEQLSVRFNGGMGGIQCGQRTMFDLRDAIDEGVRALREGGRSEVSPRT